uniref:Uncharacterized protein n=1 Tax=Oryza sativa subsp. japonica TaxID=39947 RepID=Q6YYN9_ORYSJ|nr:hypothetical protein [Oryza sativa Japonica Group]
MRGSEGGAARGLPYWPPPTTHGAHEAVMAAVAGCEWRPRWRPIANGGRGGRHRMGADQEEETRVTASLLAARRALRAGVEKSLRGRQCEAGEEGVGTGRRGGGGAASGGAARELPCRP